MVFESLATSLQPWADYYAASAVLPLVVLTAHVVSVFVGGGVAVATDRRLLRAEPGSSESFIAIAEDLQGTHRLVVSMLSITILSGLAMAAADVASYATLRLFWAKMGLIVLLLLNGALMRRTETQLLGAARQTREEPIAGPTVTGPWRHLRSAAWRSLVCWLGIVILGVLVSNQ
ncbi:MAG: hypothetical protein IBJ03_14630 [Gemmatimonadaceae bacterium]|nr:hypothetical protein [Gemmatimonadaceae bacterium]